MSDNPYGNILSSAMANEKLELPKADKVETKENSTEIKKEEIYNLDINSLIEYKENIFSQISQEKYEELKESISENGVLFPIIVRKTLDNKYEVIAGNNRVRACKELGLNTVPARIKDVDDNVAKLIMIDTNVSLRDRLLPSELMKAYCMKQEILKNSNFGHDVQNADNTTEPYNAREILAKTENISGRQIARYIKLKELLPELLRCVDKELITLVVGVELSYLTKEIQTTVMNILNDNPTLKMSLKQAELLKSTKEELTEEYILSILNNKTSKQKPKFTGKVKPTVVKKYKDKFANDEEFTELIETLLENHFANTEKKII